MHVTAFFASAFLYRQSTDFLNRDILREELAVSLKNSSWLLVVLD